MDMESSQYIIFNIFIKPNVGLKFACVSMFYRMS